MKYLVLFFFFIFAGQSLNAQTRSAPVKETFSQILDHYEEGRYREALKMLNNFQGETGLVSYWKGLCHLRLNNFDEGIEQLKKSVALEHEASDLYYEYGQALYTSLRQKEARLAFKKSIEKKYKMAVSMYYIGHISQELGDFKTAASFYNAIETLPLDEKKDVVQAARMRLAEIYLEQIKKQGGGSGAIEEYVLPQYRKAYEWDKESLLGKEIKQKIEKIERRYDLVLFQLRNGRPTARPAHFLKTNVKYRHNDNVNAVDEETKKNLDPAQVAASSISYEAYGRYAFYPNATYSLVPQFNFGYTKFLSDQKEITQNNNYFFTASLQTSYEHMYNQAPATTYLDVDYTYSADDRDQNEEVEKAEDSLLFTLSEQIQIWANHPSIFRLKSGQTKAVDEENNKTTLGAVYEQMILVGNSIFYLYSGYDVVNYSEQESANNNSFTLRIDALLPAFYGLFNPNFYASQNQIEYVEDEERGSTFLRTLGVNLNRPVGKNLYFYIDYGISRQSGPKESDNYQQQTLTANLDYIF